MATALAYIRWENVGELCRSRPLAFSSRYERLHELESGDCLWLFSRNPTDNQYCAVARLAVTRRFENPATSVTGQRFDRFGVEADLVGVNSSVPTFPRTDCFGLSSLRPKSRSNTERRFDNHCKLFVVPASVTN